MISDSEKDVLVQNGISSHLLGIGSKFRVHHLKGVRWSTRYAIYIVMDDDPPTTRINYTRMPSFVGRVVCLVGKIMKVCLDILVKMTPSYVSCRLKMDISC